MTYFPQSSASDQPGGGDTAASPQLSLRQRLGAFWLNLLFWVAAHAPWLARGTVNFWVWAGWLFSPAMRRNTLANARQVLGETSTPRARRKLARQWIRGMFLFVYDVGRHSHMTLTQMRAEVKEIQGQSHYDAARALRRGLIVATAHFGAFEGAVAALRDRENEVHVVFQRDRFSRFDVVRSQLHERLGIHEAPIDDGVRSWMRIREALLRDEAVLIQADRVMPGQRGMRMPFFGGEVEIPIGPAKLALLTGAPIVPIFAVRSPQGTLTIEIQPPILIDAASSDPLTVVVRKLAAAIETMIQKHPEQWLMLHQPWCEKTVDASQEVAATQPLENPMPVEAARVSG